ncbi:TetR family transcriptional regulator [Mycolicibacterium duvalii]|uniref:TetR family transcriptional regulator n=1 Tax=Mycolicibacterium duvalii TaxID=39688 RepID=A0A7I7JYF3_9MYCO|nr:TetR/AcrR family transcriptional regulator [Mycolicibacterium duvalii]MCV7369491.1 TetR/AcrR family transcriptional regulator [Mycolicibacterium duvalii]PEG42131.1 TetR family transcriptional regulator [Mycolicibacterium duvalii]BBX16211.1 TetR family transcriptional regulator [Mycolicibacterium duvalii]
MRSPTDRRQPQKSDIRRTAILESLDHHLRESGFDALNIADVTRRAGVTRSAFYFYFENKAAAVAALLEPMYDDGFMARDLLSSTDRPPRARIRGMLDALLDTVDEHRYLLQAMLEARATSAAVRTLWDDARESFVPSVAAMINGERSGGRAPAGTAPDVLASLLLEFNDRLMERYTVGGRLSRDDLLSGAETIWLRTIYAEDGA